MIKSESNNTFGEGLMMDMNPLTTPNSVMTNCLNGTLITFNGNEYILQNDMGNGRVETAYLPEGFVPLGTTELGGIIYIVSYNPNTNRCQIGSFPSPERNITSDEIEDSPTVTLGNTDFGYSDSNKEAKVYYLKKNLNSKLTFNPGDKFIVYGDTVDDNKEKIQGIDYSGKDITDETIRLYIGTITSDGKLIVFDNLKRFKINDNGNEYYIYQYDNNESSGGKPDLDDYRSLVQQPYNIFNSKISGELVVIAELVQCTTFEAEISHVFDTNKQYIPNVTFKFGGEYNYIPFGVQCKFQLIGKSINTDKISLELKCKNRTEFSNDFSYTDTADNILSGTAIATALQDYDFNKQDRDPLVLTYEFTPCMNWGPVKYLTVRGQIDLAKLGTGIIELNSWKYYNTDKKCSLTWGLDVYEEEGCSVSKVEFDLTRYISKTAIETITYKINPKTSYHGTFYEVIPFDQEYYKIEESKKLRPNNLYLAKIVVTYNRPKGESPETRTFYRWLYTNSYFNDQYYKEQDYNDIPLKFDTKVLFGYDTTSTSTQQEKYGVIKAKVVDDNDTNSSNLESKTSMSAIQTVKSVSAECTAQFVLQNDYNTFNLRTYDGGASLSIKKDEASLTMSCDFKYTDREDSDYKTFLENNVMENWDGTTPDLSTATAEQLISGKDADKNDKYGNAINISSNNPTTSYDSSSDKFSFDIDYKLLQLTKAYCSKTRKQLSYTGKFIPLAYNSDTFSDYNLIASGSQWFPDILGTFGFKEPGGTRGLGYIGLINKDGTKTETQYKKANDLDINFGLDADIVDHENKNGWKGTAMFIAHYGTSKNNPRQEWKSTSSKSSDWVSYSTDRWFSVDPCYQSNSSLHFVGLAMKSAANDGYYYPLNFCMRTNMGNNVSNYFSSSSYYKNLYQMFAQILNNIYRFEGESTVQPFIIPESVYYGDNYKYGVNIPIEITIDNTSNCSIEIMLEDENLVDLSYFRGLIPTGDTTKVNTANITGTVNNVTGESTLIINDTNFSSIDLRNTIMDAADVNLGNVVYDFDGETVIGEQPGNYKSSDLYCRLVTGTGSSIKVQDTVEKAVTFRPVTISYADGKAKSTKNGSGSSLLYKTKSGADWTDSANSKQNLTKEFALTESGHLVIKHPDKIGFSFKRGGNHDTGNVTGYQKIGFSKAYKAWK